MCHSAAMPPVLADHFQCYHFQGFLSYNCKALISRGCVQSDRVFTNENDWSHCLVHCLLLTIAERCAFEKNTFS